MSRLGRRDLVRLALGGAASTLFLGPSRAHGMQVAPRSEFSPARTWVLSIGVLEFARSDLFASFPTAGRKDDALCDTWIARGVPAAQVVRVRDRRATSAEILRQLDTVVARVPPGHDLFVYYAGHGVQDDDGTTYFTATDSGDHTTTGYVPHAALLDRLDARFRGAYALMFADCCYSGALPALLGSRAANRPYAALASSLASEISTGHWTFTESIIAAFSGEPRVDLRHDGTITIDDLARFTEEEMAFAEGQLAPFRMGHFPNGYTLGPARPQPFARYGERVMARWTDGRFYPAHITGGDVTGAEIQYVGEDVDARVVQPADTLRPYVPEEHAVGTRVEVRWHRRWYPATVREARHGVHRVHYDAFEDAWDEWVSRKRIRAVTTPATGTAPTGRGTGRRGRPR